MTSPVCVVEYIVLEHLITEVLSMMIDIIVCATYIGRKSLFLNSGYVLVMITSSFFSASGGFLATGCNACGGTTVLVTVSHHGNLCWRTLCYVEGRPVKPGADADKNRFLTLETSGPTDMDTPIPKWIRYRLMR